MKVFRNPYVCRSIILYIHFITFSKGTKIILSAKDNEFLYKKITQENPLYSDIKEEKLFKEFEA